MTKGFFLWLFKCLRKIDSESHIQEDKYNDESPWGLMTLSKPSIEVWETIWEPILCHSVGSRPLPAPPVSTFTVCSVDVPRLSFYYSEKLRPFPSHSLCMCGTLCLGFFVPHCSHLLTCGAQVECFVSLLQRPCLSALSKQPSASSNYSRILSLNVLFSSFTTKGEQITYLLSIL